MASGKHRKRTALAEAFETIDIAIIGAGPAGLAAAEVAAQLGRRVVLFEAKPSPARKFLMAGKSGLNLTKDERIEDLLNAINCPRIEPMLRAFGSEAVQAWAKDLGEPIFTGSSGRVFPKAMKGSPLLRKWLARSNDMGVELRPRWRWSGWEGDALRFETPERARLVSPRATVLALGGASWARLGSDAAWLPWLQAKGVEISPFRPANMGFDVNWSDVMRARFAGAPVKPVALSVGSTRVKGECVVTTTGIEGSAVYAISAALRDAMEVDEGRRQSSLTNAPSLFEPGPRPGQAPPPFRVRGQAALAVDLMPDSDFETVARKLSKPRGKASISNHLRKALGLAGVKMALLRECSDVLPTDPTDLAKLIKSAPLEIARPRPIDEAISVAGGVSWPGVDDQLMLRALPHIYVAGEMLDWEAPTGGYLLTACIATGRWAGHAAAQTSLP